MKNDALLGRCSLAGQVGDAMNVSHAGAGHSLGKLLALGLRAQLPWLAFRICSAGLSVPCMAETLEYRSPRKQDG